MECKNKQMAQRVWRWQCGKKTPYVPIFRCMTSSSQPPPQLCISSSQHPLQPDTVSPQSSPDSLDQFQFGDSPVLIYIFINFLLFRAIPAARGQIGAELPAYTTAIATWDPGCICDLHHSPWQRWILNPLIKAWAQTHILMDTSWVLNPLSDSRNSDSSFLKP